MKSTKFRSSTLCVVTLLLAAVTSGCGDDDTAHEPTSRALVLELQSPDQDTLQLSEIRLSVSPGASPDFEQSYGLPVDARLPGTVTLYVSGGDPLPGTLSPGVAPIPHWTSTVTIKLDGLTSDGVVKVSRLAVLDAVPTGLQKLTLSLAKDCADVSCKETVETCNAGACESSAVTTASLPTVTQATP